MTGRRKRTGQAVRRVESTRRSIAMHKARVAAATTNPGRIRAATDLVLRAAARVEEINPAAASRAATRMVAEAGRIVRDLEKEIR